MFFTLAASSFVLTGLRGKLFHFLNIFQLCHANELPNKLDEFSGLKFLRDVIQSLTPATGAYETRNENTLSCCPFQELLAPHRCSPVGTAVLPNFSPCSAATGQLGHLHRGWCTYIWKCLNLKQSVCVWTRTLRWGVMRWLWVSPCFATAAPCGASRPG